MAKIHQYRGYYFATFRHWRKLYHDYAPTMNYVFRYLSKGSGWVKVADQLLPMEEGDLVYIPRNTPYEAYWKGEDYAEIITCETPIFPEAQAQIYTPPYWARAIGGQRTTQTIPEPFLPQLIDRKFTEEFLQIPRDQAPNTRALAMFFAWLEKVIPSLEKAKTDVGMHLMERFCEYVVKNPGSRIPEIAAHCGVSEPTMYNTIRKTTGMTPNTMRQSVLVNQAVHLLSTTDKPVADIAEMLFFSSPNYFRKIFREYTGKSPSQIRKAHRPEK